MAVGLWGGHTHSTPTHGAWVGVECVCRAAPVPCWFAAGKGGWEGRLGKQIRCFVGSRCFDGLITQLASYSDGRNSQWC
jgi:hypothetical protein